MTSQQRFTIFRRPISIFLLILLVLVVIPQETFAQRERKIRPVEMTEPIGSPRALQAAPLAPVESPDAKSLNLTETPKDDETAIRDSVSATELAWACFDRQKYAKSQEWFTLALQWNPKNLHAAEGLVMAMFENSDPQTAYYVARELNEKIPGIKKLVVESATTRARGLIAAGKAAEARTWVTGYPVDETGFATVFAEVEKASEGSVLKLATVNGIENGRKIESIPNVPTDQLLTHAKEAMREGRYRVSQWYLSQVESRQQLGREDSIMKAWNYFHTRNFDLGAALFEELYRAEESIEAAEGLSFCLQQSRDFDTLANLSSELGGMLTNTADPIIQTSEKQQQARETATTASSASSASSETDDPSENAPASVAESAVPESTQEPGAEKLQAIR